MTSLSPQRQRNMASTSRRYDDMNCIVEASSEAGAIYLGNLDAASDIDLLQSHRIGAVLSLCPDPIPSIVKQKLLFHQFHYVEDHDQFNISTFFDTTYQFLEKSRKQTNVLIHCYAGISRSATILIAYLMRKLEMGAREAMDLVQRRRWQIYPNNGFLKQLSTFEKKLYFKQQDQKFEQFEPKQSIRNSLSDNIRDWRVQLFDKKPASSSALNTSVVLSRSEYQELAKKYTRDDTERKSYQSRLNTSELMKSLDMKKSNLLQSTIPSSVRSTAKTNGFLRKVTSSDNDYFRLTLNKMQVQKDKDEFESKFNRLGTNELTFGKKLYPSTYNNYNTSSLSYFSKGSAPLTSSLSGLGSLLNNNIKKCHILDLSQTQKGTNHYRKPMSYLHY